MTVRNLLVEAGLDGASVDVTSDGELDLLVKTPDETPEPRNRRVVIRAGQSYLARRTR